MITPPLDDITPPLPLIVFIRFGVDATPADADDMSRAITRHTCRLMFSLRCWHYAGRHLLRRFV